MKKLYELELKLKWRQPADSTKESKEQMLEWIQQMLKNDDILWRMRLTATYKMKG